VRRFSAVNTVAVQNITHGAKGAGQWGEWGEEIMITPENFINARYAVVVNLTDREKPVGTDQ